MFSSVSHEFRTPLNSFENSLTLLEANCAKAQSLYPNDTRFMSIMQSSAKFIKIGQVSSKILLNLTEDILDFAKMEAGIFSLTETPFVVGEVLEAVQFVFEMQCDRKGLDLQFECPDSLRNSTIMADSGRIKQVLLNLVGNSFKFTNSGFIKVTIRKVSIGQLEFEVADSGIGISEEDSTGLFHMFGIVHKQREVFNMRGTGLGLTISQKLTNQMGGQISLKSEEGVGTKVTFTIRENISNSE